MLSNVIKRSLLQVKDALTDMYYEGDYMYTPVQDSLASNTKSKIRQRREKGRPTSKFGTRIYQLRISKSISY
jgi:hypothetical protein